MSINLYNLYEKVTCQIRILFYTHIPEYKACLTVYRQLMEKSLLDRCSFQIPIFIWWVVEEWWLEAWFQKWWSWKRRIVFSSVGVGEERLHAAGGAIVHTPPAGHNGSFRYRITWRRSSHQPTRHFVSNSGSHFDSSGSCSCTTCPPSSSSSDLYS